MTLLIIGIILVVLLAGTIYMYNKLVRNRNKMQEAWSIIDVFLKKRHELIPALVDSVKGYATHEHKTLEKIIRRRSEAMRTNNIDSRIIVENQLNKTLNDIFMVVESYPELQASDSFLKLQNQLSDMENDLEKARRYYNGTVRENNAYIESFPANMAARLFQFEKGAFYNAESLRQRQPELAEGSTSF